ncbi:type II secretion system protein M [Methylomonas sp. SURF-2]|uniref:Type II secretion system protein M n=1 Tax=Methylomonas subterranea TaxID=2952225 RepID=A0ABT1TDI5_9GAMM|nr:type II secretion system protein GspM [Methylomonas sp. SURF-2]MCQ8103510.1 type II secretion system protein M [Methylomonas sp. SURF-2]
MPFDKTDVIRRWRALSAREQMLAVAGMAVVALAAVYGGLYEPMREENRRLRQQLQVRQQVRQHLREVAQRAAQLRGSGEYSAVSPMEPAAAIAGSSRQLDLESYIGKRQAAAEEGIELELQAIPFDKLVYWLAVMRQQHGVVVAKLDMRRHAADSPLLDGTLTLGGINRGPE